MLGTAEEQVRRICRITQTRFIHTLWCILAAEPVQGPGMARWGAHMDGSAVVLQQSKHPGWSTFLNQWFNRAYHPLPLSFVSIFDTLPAADSRFSSFVRQLHYFGFTKVHADNVEIVYWHPCFQEHFPALVQHISRKTESVTTRQIRAAKLATVEQLPYAHPASEPDPAVWEREGVPEDGDHTSFFLD